jgi:hypothetical protein
MLTYLEDYLEFIAGARDLTGQLIPRFVNTPVVSLANYDYGIVDSFAEQTLQGRGLTDRQSALAKKLVHKYRRQLKGLGVSVPEQLDHRIPIRVVDRSRTLIHNPATQNLELRFPFDGSLVEKIRNFGQNSCGQVAFDRDLRCWLIAATLPNVYYCWAWAQHHEFDIKFDIDELAKNLEQEVNAYTLTQQDHQYQVTPPISSLDLTELNSGTMSLLAILNQATVWQVSVSEDILNQARAQYPKHWLDWTLERDVEIRSDQYSLSEVCGWLKALGRAPIFIKGFEHSLDTIQECFGADQVCQLDNSRRGRKKSVPQVQVYMSSVLNNNQCPVPRIVFTDESVIYGIQSRYSGQADKIVYYGVNNLIKVKNT